MGKILSTSEEGRKQENRPERIDFKTEGMRHLSSKTEIFVACKKTVRHKFGFKN